MKRGIRFSIVFIMHMCAMGAFAQMKDVADWSAIKSELELVFKTDQAMRVEYNTMLAEARAKGVEVDTTLQAAIWKRIGEQDRANQQRVTVIVDKYGWPKKSQVGQVAAMAAFLVVQHASLDVQLKYVAHLREATASGEASTQNLALLEDRLLIRQGQPQRYGTQVDTQNGLSLLPTEDETNLDAKRASMGLGPICEHLNNFVKTSGPIVYPPCMNHVPKRE